MLKLALRSLRANTLRMLLTVLSVVLAVAFTTGTLIITDGMDRSVDELFEGSDADIAVVVGPAVGADAATVSLDTAREVERVAGVADVHPMVTASVEVLGIDRAELTDDDAPLSAAAWHDRPEGTVTFPEGDAPRADDRVALREDFAADAGVGVDDRVVLRVDGTDHRLTVSGLFEDGGIAGAGGGTVALLDAAAAREILLGDASAAQLLYVAGEEGTDQEELAEAIPAEVGGDLTATPMDRVREEALGPLRESVAFLGVILTAFAAIALLVGGFLIVNTFSMLVAQRNREFALLRAVGADRGQVGRAVLGEAFLVGSLGAALGIGIGIGLAEVVLGALDLAGMAIPQVELEPTPVSIAAGALLGVVVTVLAAYGPQRRAAKVPPVAALRDSATAAQRPLRNRSIAGTVILVVGGAALAYGLLVGGPDSMAAVSLGALLCFLGLIVIAPFLARPVVGALSLPFPYLSRASGRLARNNAVREPRRTAATALALMIGLGLVAAIGTISESAMASVEDQVDRQMGADYVIRSAESSESLAEDLLTDLAAVPGVDSVVPVTTAPARMDGADTAVLELHDGFEDAIGWTLASGSGSPGRDELLVSTALAEQEDWTTGTVVDAVFPDGTEASLTVAGVFERNNLVGADYALSGEGFDHYVEEPLTALAYGLAAAADEGTTEELVERAEDSGATVMDRAALKESNQELFSQRAGLIYGLLGLSILIAALGIANTLTLSTWERTREIGLLRAVGMSRGQVQRMIWLESLAISVFGALMGIVIGVGLAVALQSVLYPLGVTVLAVPYDLLAVLLGMSVVIGLVAAVWPAWRAARVDVLRAVSSQ